MWIWSSAFAAMPLPLARDGVAVGIEAARAGSEVGQWAIAGLSPGVGDRGGWARVRLATAAVADAHGLRLGLADPILDVAVVRTHLSAGARLTAPLGSPRVAQRSLGATPWIAGRMAAGPVDLTGQIGLTLAASGRPVALPGPDVRSLAHGTGSLEAAPGPDPWGVADPMRSNTVHARALVGPPGTYAAAELATDGRHVDLTVGIALQGRRGSLAVGVPIVGGGTGLTLAGELRIQSPSR